MSSASDIQLAARRLVELQSITSKLFDCRKDALYDLERSILTYQQPTWGRRELRADLNECEWALYQYTSLLHMLGELCDRTRNEFDVQLQTHSQIRYEVPKLIGIRHAIHHNGLIGLNIAEIPDFSEPIVVMPLQSIRKHGNWGNENPKFQTFFHDVAGEIVVMESLLKRSASVTSAFINEHIGKLYDMFGEDDLSKEAASVKIYD